jgi:hypothetical protein
MGAVAHDGLQLRAQFCSIHACAEPVHCPCAAHVGQLACQSVPEHGVVAGRGAAVATMKTGAAVGGPGAAAAEQQLRAQSAVPGTGCGVGGSGGGGSGGDADPKGSLVGAGLGLEISAGVSMEVGALPDLGVAVTGFVWSRGTGVCICDGTADGIADSDGIADVGAAVSLSEPPALVGAGMPVTRQSSCRSAVAAPAACLIRGDTAVKSRRYHSHATKHCCRSRGSIYYIVTVSLPCNQAFIKS